MESTKAVLFTLIGNAPIYAKITHNFPLTDFKDSVIH